MDADDGAALPGSDAGRLDERRHWERLAYGRGSSDAERSAAFDALARLSPPTPAPRPVLELPRPAEQDRAGSSTTFASSSGSPVSRGELNGIPDDAPDAPPPTAWRPPARRAPWGVLATLVLAAVIAAMFFAVLRAADPSDAIFARAQSASDKALPSWLADGLVAGGGSRTRESEEGLLDSVRLVEDGAHDAYVFRDARAETVCLAASKAVTCVDSDEFAREGIRLDALDPDGDTLQAAVHYKWGPMGGLKAEEYLLEEPVSVRFLAASGWADLVEECLADRGRRVWVSASGGIVRLDDGGTPLAYAMAEFDCTRRYLRNGYYFAGSP